MSLYVSGIKFLTYCGNEEELSKSTHPDNTVDGFEVTYLETDRSGEEWAFFMYIIKKIALIVIIF